MTLQSAGAWNNVKSLPLGATVRVAAGSRTLTGQLESVMDESLVLLVSDHDSSLLKIQGVLNDIALLPIRSHGLACPSYGMKSYIRQILNDLNLTTKAKTPEAPLPEDLSNQTLSNDPAERVRQLDWQAQKDEERQTS